MNNGMKYFLAALTSAIVTIIGALGAFSVKLDYERGMQKQQFELSQANHQEKLGQLAQHLTITFSKDCNKGG